MITSFNSATSRDLSPVINVLTTVAGIAGSLYKSVQPSVESRWDDAHPELSSAREEIARRILPLISELASCPVEHVAMLSEAIDALRAQLAGLRRLRRDWISQQLGPRKQLTVELGTRDLVSLPDPAPPESLDDPAVPDAQRALVSELNVLVARCDHEVHEREVPLNAEPEDLSGYEDAFLYRRPRLVTLAVYTRDDADRRWLLAPESTATVAVVDEYSIISALDLTAGWFTERSQSVEFHPDQRMKTWATQSTSSVGSVLSAGREVATAVADAYQARLAASGTERAAAAEKADNVLKLNELAAGLALLPLSQAAADALAGLKPFIE